MKRLLGTALVALALIPGVLALQTSAHAAPLRGISPNVCVVGGPCGPCAPNGICLDSTHPSRAW